MEENNNPKGYKRNKITLVTDIIRYVTGLLFLFSGIIVCLFTDDIIPGIYAILIGIIATPVIADAIEKKINLSHNITLLVSVIRYAIGLIFLLAGMGGLFYGEIPQGVISILIGIILTPVISDLIEKKMNLSVSLSLRFFIVLCLFYAIGITVDPVDSFTK